MSRLKKAIVLTLVSIMLTIQLFLPLSVAKAQENWYDQDFTNWYGRVYSGGNPSELFGERYTAAQVQWIFYSLISTFMNLVGSITGDGGNFSECAAAIFSDEVNNIFTAAACAPYLADILLFINPIGDAQQSPSPVASVFSLRPISSTSYFTDIAQRLHFIETASAQDQGFGFESTNMILPLWEAARDVSYFLLVMVLMIMAFMIMFRVKISPQMVITIQSAIPKIVITLLLVTFSYAIAGLMIDLMYVAVGILTTILRNAEVIDTSASPDWAATFGELTHNNSIFKLMFAFWILSILGSFNAFISTAGTFYVGGVIIGALMIIVMSIVCLYLLVKVSFMLVKNFVLLLFKIVFGPLEIVFGAVGGGGFKKWAMDMLTLLAVYPVTGLLMVFSFLFLRGAFPVEVGSWGSNIWPFDVSDMIGTQSSWSPPLTGSEDMNIVWLFAGIAIMMMVPKVPDMIKGAMSGRGFDYESAISEYRGPAQGGLTGYAGYTLNKASGGELPIPVVGGRSSTVRRAMAYDIRRRGSISDAANRIFEYGRERKRLW